MNKKGLSPMVATLLLIAFAIALGLVVMSWGKGYIEEKAEFVAGSQDMSACKVIRMNVIQVAGADKICYDTSDYTISVFLENGPESAVSNMQARIIGTGGVHTVDSILGKPIGKDAARDVVFSYPQVVGEIQQVKLIPKVGKGDQASLCPEAAVVLESVNPC